VSLATGDPPSSARDSEVSSAASTPVQSYADLLAAFEARRRTRDVVLLRKMMQPREPMNPG
jgi:hypothetical protein